MCSSTDANSEKESNSAVPGPITELVEIFETHLGDVAFPGVDAASLRTLTELTEQTAQILAAADQAAADARRAYDEAWTSLGRAADRGVDYARVFAADDEALLAQLVALPLGRGKPRRTGGKRGPRKAPPKPDELQTSLERDGEPDSTVAKLPVAKRKRKAGAA